MALFKILENPKVWEDLCNVTSQPLAVVSLSNKFLWVNSAFADLVGYSRVELTQRSWMDITIFDDIQGDKESVDALLSGASNKYKLSKKYRHKFGHEVPIELSVWRFPKETHLDLSCFIVQAMGEEISLDEFADTLTSLEKRVKEMSEKRIKDDASVSVHFGDHAGADMVGRDKNSSNTIKYLAGMGIVALIVFCWAMYYLVSILKPGLPDPPKINPETPAEVLNVRPTHLDLLRNV